MLQQKSVWVMVALVVSALMISAGCGNDLGTRLSVDDNAIYYTNDVEKSEAEDVADWLESNNFFGGTSGKVLQLDKRNETYIFRMPVKEGQEKNTMTLMRFKQVATGLSQNVFDGSVVDVQLCDKEWETLRTVVSN